MEKLRWLVEEGGGQGMVEYVSVSVSVTAISIGILTEFGLEVADFYAKAEVRF